ncbi:conserved hypothetical protein [Talaromyces stipitatus ATCC 10500]|uniref:HAT C-terminal dimerisation domain-containing protein n=1 Tax=Talaromyces stipitatus (strain ATCC 10500 / CBS 375.48 / QM 6759 / NRRL 1006) TaxID=441959 RepID=B8MJP8_TALSN|nr:uncharacterized protein TSTA_051840 [Talaromyces stipitatus ATCC 10500]EED15747.1 conserved hypothetical protein [Talaromyces stipitatus ATCC 10500]
MRQLQWKRVPWKQEMLTALDAGIEKLKAYYNDTQEIHGTVKKKPCDFWKEMEDKYPTLARVAWDIFSIPATGAGVERLFNSARDICYYQRGSLNSTTIQDLMMFQCISKFNIKVEDDREDINIPLEDRQQKDEAREAELQDIVPDPISDHEESDSEENDGEENNGEEVIQLTEVVEEATTVSNPTTINKKSNALPQPSKRALRKRRIILVEEHTDDEALLGTSN